MGLNWSFIAYRISRRLNLLAATSSSVTTGVKSRLISLNILLSQILFNATLCVRSSENSILHIHFIELRVYVVDILFTNVHNSGIELWIKDGLQIVNTTALHLPPLHIYT